VLLGLCKKSVILPKYTVVWFDNAKDRLVSSDILDVQGRSWCVECCCFAQFWWGLLGYRRYTNIVSCRWRNPYGIHIF